MKRIFALTLVLLLAASVLTGCGGSKEPAATEEPAPTREPVVESTPEPTPEPTEEPAPRDPDRPHGGAGQ